NGNGHEGGRGKAWAQTRGKGPAAPGCPLVLFAFALFLPPSRLHRFSKVWRLGGARRIHRRPPGRPLSFLTAGRAGELVMAQHPELIVSVSGVRGVIGRGLTPDVALAFAAALGTYVQGGRVVLSRDGRPSGAVL